MHTFVSIRIKFGNNFEGSLKIFYQARTPWFIDVVIKVRIVLQNFMQIKNANHAGVCRKISDFFLLNRRKPQAMA